MNRLVRISLTLFVSSTVMLGLVILRVREAARIPDPIAQLNEQKMAYLGIGIAAILLVSGVAVLVAASVKGRKSRSLHG